MNDMRALDPGDTVVILPGTKHKIVNTSVNDVVMIVACAPTWNVEDNVFLK